MNGPLKERRERLDKQRELASGGAYELNNLAAISVKCDI
jgi:hypothetical protein